MDDADADALDDAPAPAVPHPDRQPAAGAADEVPDAPVPLVVQRHGAVLAALRSSGARRVVDLGCGSGALRPALLAEPAFPEVVGVDVSHRALQEAAKRLRLDRMPERKRPPAAAAGRAHLHRQAAGRVRRAVDRHTGTCPRVTQRPV